MIELIMALAVLVGLAKRKGRGGRRSFRKYLKGQIQHDMSLGTLASKTLIGELVADTLDEKAWLSSVKASWSLSNWTQSTLDGPIMVGVAHSDYSDAQVEEWIEQIFSWNQGDKPGQEIARRHIRRVGVFNRAPGVPADWITLNDGRPVTTKCGWQLVTGQTVRLWAYNMGGSPLGTTDPIVHVNGHANLWPN